MQELGASCTGFASKVNKIGKPGCDQLVSQYVRPVLAALRIRPFGRLLATYTLDEAADWLVGIALAILVYKRTGSALGVALLLMATRFGPSLIITPLAGRLGALRLGRTLGALYLLAAAGATILAVGTAAPLGLLYALTFATATCAATGRVLTRTAACNLLDRHGLLREGAAAINVSYGAINVLGPATAGAVAVLVGPQAGVLLGAGIFAGLAASVWTVTGSAAGEDSDEAPAGLREGWRVLTSSPGIAAVILGAAALLVLFSMDEPVLLPYVERSLGGDAGDYATLLTFWGVGILLGSACFTFLRRWSMLGVFVLAGSLLAGAYVGLGLAQSTAAAFAVAIGGGIGNGMFWGAFNVITLEAVPPAMRTRTSGVVESLALATPGIGYLLGGGLSELLSPAQVYLIAGATGGAVVLALGLVAWRPARVARPATVLVPSPSRGG